MSFMYSCGKLVYANETTKVDTFQKSLKFGLTF